MADNKFVTLEALKSTTVRLQQEWLKSISKAGHARFEVAEAIPDAWIVQRSIRFPSLLLRSARTAGWMMKRGRNTPCVMTSLPQM